MKKIFIFTILFLLLTGIAYSETLQIGVTPVGGNALLQYVSECGTLNYYYDSHAQSFMLPVDGNIQSIQMISGGAIIWGGTPSDMVISLRSSVNGSDLTNTSVSPATWNSSSQNVISIPISSDLISANTTHFFVFHEGICDNTTNMEYDAKIDNSNPYPDGSSWYSYVALGVPTPYNIQASQDWVMNITYSIPTPPVIPSYVPSHASSDIAGVVVDFGVEYGLEILKFVSIIAIVGMGIWVLGVI